MELNSHDKYLTTTTSYNTAYTLRAYALALRDIRLSANIVYADSVIGNGNKNISQTMFSMDKINRQKLVGSIKKRQKQYLERIVNLEYHSDFTNRFKNLTKKIQKLLRKDYASENSIKSIPNISMLLFGLIEDMKRKHALSYDFDNEVKIVNDYLVKYMENKISTKYDGKCASYGEALLNAYLDLFITATVFKTGKEIPAYPSFLINPKTRSNLEIDILFEDFHIAFEFQGEHHYTNTKTKEKDEFKLTACPERGFSLIPVNPSQLNSNILQKLIVNSIKDFLHLNDLFEDRRTEYWAKYLVQVVISNKQLLRFSKVAQRLYLSNIIFSESLNWLDTKSNEYINEHKRKYPEARSAKEPAPRYSFTYNDLSIKDIYKNLRYVTQVRKRK